MTKILCPDCGYEMYGNLIDPTPTCHYCFMCKAAGYPVRKKAQAITCAFDIDGTILVDERNPDPMLFDTPNYDVIALFKLLEKFGCEMYIWSGGGKSYAIRWRDKFGLKATVVDKGSFVPDICIDDEDVSLGKVNIKV